MKFKISVVVPVYNEEKNIVILHSRLKKVLKKIGTNHEIIFVNDGSSDKTIVRLKKIRKSDRKVRIISFTRNFGHMQAVSAGLKETLGEKIVVIDADLQDPPETILPMWQKAKEGFDIVYGIKIKRKEGIVKRFLFSAFYDFLGKISKVKMPANAGAFSLLDKKVVKMINNLPERNKFFSGLRAWTGFSHVGIVYERNERYAGQAKPITKLFGMAIDGILAFSYLPLRLASIFGFVFASVSFIFIIVVVAARFFFDKGIIGWASTMSTILLIGGVQLITLGIIGEYLARIYDEVKNRPEYVISEKVGFNKK